MTTTPLLAVVTLTLVPIGLAQEKRAKPEPTFPREWTLEMVREGWSPRISRGVLVLAHKDGGWRGTLQFRRILRNAEVPLRSIVIEGDRIRFELSSDGMVLRFDGRRSATGLKGVCEWKEVGNCPFTAVPGKPVAPARVVAPEIPGLDRRALQALLDKAQATHSDAVVLRKGGAVVLEERFGNPKGPIEAMSVTKSVVNLAVGHLIDAGRIASIDTPVHEYYPIWKETDKRRVTIRHLLNHTSGLQANRTTEAIYASKDFVELALGTPLARPPGRAFFYNNRAVNLLAGVVERASGERLDAYLTKHVFAPLGIENTRWTKDAAGNPHGMAGLQIDALDLAKIGQLMLNRGRWGDAKDGRRILSADWIALSTRAAQAFNPKCGLLWWVEHEWRRFTIDDGVIAAWRKGSVDKAFIEKLLPMKDRVLDRAGFFESLRECLGKEGMKDWDANTWHRQLPDGKTVWGPTVGFSANGSLGQYLVVLPAKGLVAVRQIRAGNHSGKADSFREFVEMVRAL